MRRTETGAIQEVVNFLSYFPGRPMKVEQRETALILTPTEASTFEVSLYEQGDQTMVAAERWHTHYDDPLDAAFCALWLLTPYYRLVHELKAGVLVAAWIERVEPDGWDGFDPVFFLNPEHPESWLPVGGEELARRTFCQAILPPPCDYDQLCPGVGLDHYGVPLASKLGILTEIVSELIAPKLFEGDDVRA